MWNKLISLLLAFTIVGPNQASLMATSTTSVSTGMTVSEACVKFIENEEGFSSTKYTSNSKWYIGYGTGCGSTEYPNGITEAEAETLLKTALDTYETSVNSLISKHRLTLSQCQFDALVSFTYNLGSGWMAPSNRIYDYLVNGISNYSDMQIVNAIGTWCHIGKEVNDTLVERRLKEANLFLYGDYEDDSSHNYSYVIYDPGDGDIEHDIYFYKYGEAYGELPSAALSGSTFLGWYTSTGKKLSIDDLAETNQTVYASWTSSDMSSLFTDVKLTDWYYYYINELNSENILSGYTDGTFRPDNTVSCGEALKLILLAAGDEAQTATGTHWASGYLDYAVSKGYVGAGAITDLDAPITRLLAAQIAAKALGASASCDKSPFSDTSDGYVVALYNYGVIEGNSENGSLLFKPNNSLSRAEISAIVWRVNNAEVHENQIQYGSYWVDILDSVPVNSYNSASFSKSGSIMSYNSGSVTTQVGVDVSEYQGTIDWAKVKAAGIDYAIIRVGYRGYLNGKIVLDSTFETNLKGAIAAGLDVGVYFFSQAITADEAAEEADYVLSYISGYDLTYPVVFDWEPIGKSTARTYGIATSTLCTCANTFCSKISAAGYKPMIYYNAYTGYVQYDLSKIMSYDFWYAEYSDTPSFYYNFQMWQYASNGSVDGISGEVDMDICFKTY